jgi:hypothetical protein
MHFFCPHLLRCFSQHTIHTHTHLSHSLSFLTPPFHALQVWETEPIKDLKLGISLESKMLGSEPSALTSTLGVKVLFGAVPHFQAPLSPITMTRDIYGLPP